MEIGNQIRQLRLRRGITQEAMAQHFGITPQAVSKWERGAATPDIGMLPEISAYFGVTIDELFALSDETRMERIQNMLWDVRYFDPADVEIERQFLLEKGKREPENDKPYELLADMELHLADEHKERAALYANEALKRNPESNSAHASMVMGLGGKLPDWYVSSHRALIDFYKEFVEEHPEVGRGYMWLMDHLLDAGRVEEAKHYLEKYEKVDDTFRRHMYHILICLYDGRKDDAYHNLTDMIEKYPDEEGAMLCAGDIMARTGEYEKAKAYYRRAMDVAKPPRFCDYLESVALVCELQGDFPGAIAALNEVLKVQQEEWHVSTGETADVIRRNIQRLEKKL